MLVIANNCGGADYYNLHNTEYNNPFMWSVCFPTDMVNIINNFNKINWNNVDAHFMSKHIADNNHFTYQPLVPGLTIDKIGSIYYTHYLYDQSFNIPTKIGPDKYYNKNYEYAFKKYMKHTKAMCNQKDLPCFLIITYYRHGWDDNRFNLLYTINTHYKVFVISSKLLTNLPPNIALFHEPTLESPCNLLPITMVKKYNLEISKHFMECK